VSYFSRPVPDRPVRAGPVRASPADDRPRDGRAGGWRAAWPEITIAAVLTAAISAVAYAVAGLTGAAVILAAAAVGSLITVRSLLPSGDPAAGDDYLPGLGLSAMPFTGYWRKRAGLSEGTRSLAAFDIELRATLQNLLAARLAERHGVSLQADPAAARRLLCRSEADQALWFWVDPGRPPVTSGSQPGIAPRTLARLVDRLERL
jgi:hypothetical protein